MTTLSIINKAEPELDEQIRSRIHVMLGSWMTSLKVIEMDIEKDEERVQDRQIVRCEIRVMETGGKWHLVSTQQQNLTGAVDGSLTRLRRSLQRHRQYRMQG